MTNAPGGVLAVALSLFPFTAPTTMMRLFLSAVPMWQLLLAGTVLLVIRTAAGLFKAQTMMAGQPLNSKRMIHR